MPVKDLQKKREIWNRWYQKNKSVHHARCRRYTIRKRDEMRAWLAEIKHDKACQKCGFSHPAALDYHHKSDDKEFSIADAVAKGYSKARILKEAAKCVLICANCHRIEHFNKRLGVVAQSGERTVVNRKVAGSKPVSPAKK
jgi:hypothetical protein